MSTCCLSAWAFHAHSYAGAENGACRAQRSRAPIGLIDEVDEQLSVGLRRVSDHVLDQVDPVGHKGALVHDAVLGAALQVLVVQHHVEALAGKVPACEPV